MIILLLQIYKFFNINFIQNSNVQFNFTQSYNHVTWSNDFDGITTNYFYAISCDQKSVVSAVLKSTLSTMHAFYAQLYIVVQSTMYIVNFINVLYSL